MKICNGIDGHHGPVIPTNDYEVIDRGVVITLRCTNCGQQDELAIDLFEIDIPFESVASRYLDLLCDYGFDGSSDGPFGESGIAPDFFEAPSEDMKFALVEKNRNGVQVWITRWLSLDDAIRGNADQEYAQEWSNAHIVDLTTNDIYDIIPRPIAVRRRS